MTLVDGFKYKVLNLCRDYGYSISHEDEHGAFVISKRTSKYGDIYDKWWLDAFDRTEGDRDE